MTTKTKATHTPTPWVSEVGTGKGSGLIWYRDGNLSSLVATAHDATLCQEHGGTAIDNAAFIVRAVNAHEELLEHLREAVDSLEVLAGQYDHTLKQYRPMINRIRQAIARALEK
jgi:hypothetical protein